MSPSLAAARIGDGDLVDLGAGEMLFKLAQHPDNPIVRPQQLGLVWHEDGVERLGAVFNGGAIRLGSRIVLLPRCHTGYQRVGRFDDKLGIPRYRMENYISAIWPLVSDDGVHFQRLDSVVIHGDGRDHDDFTHGIEDARIVPYSDEFLIIGAGKIAPAFDSDGDRPAFYTTRDFRTYTYHGILPTFDTRNVVPFPEHIDGRLPVLFRMKRQIQLALIEDAAIRDPARFDDLWRDLHERRAEIQLLGSGQTPHEREKIGAGPPPIKTEAGWLLLYHAVGEVAPRIAEAFGVSQPLVRAYTIGAALLDLERPERVLRRTRLPLYIPSRPWELDGDETWEVDIPYAVFPGGALVIDDRLVIYSGSGDKYVTIQGCKLDALLAYLLEHGQLGAG